MQLNFLSLFNIPGRLSLEKSVTKQFMSIKCHLKPHEFA